MLKTPQVRLLYEQGLLQDRDLQFADFMCRLAGAQTSEELFLASALVSRTTTDEKQVCFDLTHAAGKSYATIFNAAAEEKRGSCLKIRAPKLDQWSDLLLRSPVVGRPGDYRPLILDDCRRLYLFRYWNYEQQLARAIAQRAAVRTVVKNEPLLQRGMKSYFSTLPDGPNWQRVAAAAALRHQLCVITGGPGTGKTFVVAAILALMLEQNESLTIRLCAPTGKSAARLQESIRRARSLLSCPSALWDNIAEEAVTIHRLLGLSKHSARPRYDSSNPCDADVLVVDESSMVPLSLMTKMLLALPSGARVIMLGDKDQLASIEAGAILNDICDAADVGHFSSGFCRWYARMSGEKIPPERESAKRNVLTDCTVELQHSFRLNASQGIGAASREVKRGSAESAFSIIKADGGASIAWMPLPPWHDMSQHLREIIARWYKPLFSVPDISRAFALFFTFRILSSRRQGPFGATRLNQLIEYSLSDMGNMQIRRPYYHGKPIIIVSNDYTLKLFNGDVGIVWRDPGGELRARFPDGNGTFRSLPTGRLPAHESAYAMTIHKAQGSEFDEIVMIVPDSDGDLLCRELMYTGMTRASRKVTLWTDEKVFVRAVRKGVTRTSGLRDALWRYNDAEPGCDRFPQGQGYKECR